MNRTLIYTAVAIVAIAVAFHLVDEYNERAHERRHDEIIFADNTIPQHLTDRWEDAESDLFRKQIAESIPGETDEDSAPIQDHTLYCGKGLEQPLRVAVPSGARFMTLWLSDSETPEEISFRVNGKVYRVIGETLTYKKYIVIYCRPLVLIKPRKDERVVIRSAGDSPVLWEIIFTSNVPPRMAY